MGLLQFEKVPRLPVADRGARCGASCSALFGEGVQPAPPRLLCSGRRRKPSQMCLPCSPRAPGAEGGPGHLLSVRGGEPRKSTCSLPFLLSGWELDGGCWCAGLEADQSDRPSSSSGLFVRRLFFLAWHWISSPYSLLPGRPLLLAGMGWRPRRGLRES